MDSGTDPFARCQLLLEIRFWWMRMQNSQTEPGVAARLEVNPSKAPMFCLRRLEIVSAYPAQKPSTVALANHLSEKHACAHRGCWVFFVQLRLFGPAAAQYRHPHASTCQILTTRRVRFTSCDVTRILIRRQNLSPCRAANVVFRARKKDWNIIFKVAETVSMECLCTELHICSQFDSSLLSLQWHYKPFTPKSDQRQISSAASLFELGSPTVGYRFSSTVKSNSPEISVDRTF